MNAVFPAPLLMKYCTACGAVPKLTVEEAVKAGPATSSAPFVGAVKWTASAGCAPMVTLREKLSIWLPESMLDALLSSSHSR